MSEGNARLCSKENFGEPFGLLPSISAGVPSPPSWSPELIINEGVVSKETVVLRRWGSSIQKFGFINGVDNVNWPPYRDSKR